MHHLHSDYYFNTLINNSWTTASVVLWCTMCASISTWIYWFWLHYCCLLYYKILKLQFELLSESILHKQLKAIKLSMQLHDILLKYVMIAICTYQNQACLIWRWDMIATFSADLHTAKPFQRRARSTAWKCYLQH